MVIGNQSLLLSQNETDLDLNIDIEIHYFSKLYKIFTIVQNVHISNVSL